MFWDCTEYDSIIITVYDLNEYLLGSSSTEYCIFKITFPYAMAKQANEQTNKNTTIISDW